MVLKPNPEIVLMEPTVTLRVWTLLSSYRWDCIVLSSWVCLICHDRRGKEKERRKMTKRGRGDLLHGVPQRQRLRFGILEKWFLGTDCQGSGGEGSRLGEEKELIREGGPLESSYSLIPRGHESHPRNGPILRSKVSILYDHICQSLAVG